MTAYGRTQYRPMDPPARRGPRRYLAGFLSAVVPGLGLLYAGRFGLAFAFLLPTIALLVLFALVVLGAPTQALASLFDPTILLVLLVLQGLVLLYRLLAVGSSVSDRRMGRFTGQDALPMMLLLAFVILPQLWLAYATTVLRDTSEQIFLAGAEPGEQPRPLASPPNWSTGDRVNVLILGVDSGAGRTQSLTDTIIVASVDPVGETVSMLSVPRDLVDVPLPTGSRFSPKINSLISYVEANPTEFPGQGGDGVEVLATSLGLLLDRPIHYYARVNLGGFVEVVDSLGGVDVQVTKSIDAPAYGGYGVDGFSIRPGRHHLNGGEALAYARIRKATGENDFTRAARQQEVLVALRDRVVQGGFVTNVTGFLGAVGETLETDMPADRLPFLAGLIDQIGRDEVYRAVIEPPLVELTSDDRGSILVPDVVAIRGLADDLFPPPGTEPRVPGTAN